MKNIYIEETSMNISRFMKSAIYTLFFISGFTGLVYEVTWTRMLTTVFGSTTYAITSVLCAFMGGLAIGGFVIGRYVGGLPVKCC